MLGMAGFQKYRTSRSVSPETPSYGLRTWIRRSAMSSQFNLPMDSMMEVTEGLSGVSHKTGYVSPLRARTMKEYEQQITELQKENFNLKLRLYFLEEKMDKNFDSDTKQLHEVNIQLKIEAENLRKDLEEKEKLLKDTRTSQQRVEERYEKEFQELKAQLEREHNREDKEFSNTDVSESIQSDIEAKEMQLAETMTTLQRLDQLQQEELVDLREMAREKQTSLNNYVARVKELQEQQHSVAESASSKSSQNFPESALSDGSCSQDASSIESVSRMKLPELPDIELCTVCGNQTKKILEDYIAETKKKTLKRDIVIKGLTETVYKRIKEIEKLKSSLAEKESVELVMKALLKMIDVAVNNPCKYEKVKDALKKLRSFLAKTQPKLKTNSDKKWPEEVIKSLEIHFMQWIISLHCDSEKTDEKDAEELLKEQEKITEEHKKSMKALLITVRQKDAFLQDLCCKLESISDTVLESSNLGELASNSNSYKKHLEELSGNLNYYKIQVEELETIMKTLLSENSELKSTYTEMRKTYDDAINQKDIELNKTISLYKKAMENLTRLQQDLSDKEDCLIKCKNELSDLKEKCQFLQQQSAHNVSNQEKQVQLLNERLENAYSANNEMRNAYEELDTKFHSVVEEKDQQIEISSKRYKELQNEFVSIQSSLSEKNNQCSQLKNELDCLAQKFNVVQQEKMFQSAEIDKLKLHLENSKMVSSESKEREIQNLKDLVQEKTLKTEGLIVELQLKDSMMKQLKEELEASRVFIGAKETQLNKTLAEKDISDVHNLKRYSLPVNFYPAEKISIPAFRYNKLMSQRLSNFGRSDNIIELKEEIYFLMLRIENLEQQVRDYDEGIGSKLSLLSGVSGIVQDSSLNRTTKTWHVLHAHIEELANFLERLLQFDCDGQLDTSLLTPKNVARLKQYLLDSKELSQSLSASLLGNETAAIDSTLDMEPSKDMGRMKEWFYTEKILEEKTGKQQNFERTGILGNSFQVNNHNNQSYGMGEPGWLQYVSSDSDIWSEPDRAVSMQRMGLNINVQARLSHSSRKVTSPRCDPDKNSAENMNKDKKVKKLARPDMKENLKNQVAECHAALQDKVEECHNLVHSKEVLEKELSECQDELASCREMLETLQSQLEEKDKEYQKLLKEKHQLEEEEKANHHSHEETHRKLVALNNRFESMQLKLSEEENKVLAISTERCHLAHQLENKVCENRQIQDWNLRLQKELGEKETVCQQYQETKSKMQHLEENCAKLQGELTEQHRLGKSLTNEVAMLKKEANHKDKKLKEVMLLAQKLEESAAEKSFLYKNEKEENMKRVSELEKEKNELQKQLEEMGKKLVETEKSLQEEYQTQNNAKEELLNELIQLKKELAQNVNANKKLRHRLEKLHKQENTQAVKDVGKGDNLHIVPTVVNSATPAVTKGAYPLMKAKDFDNTMLLQRNKTKWKSCESLQDKINDSLHIIDLSKSHSLNENIKEQFCHFSTVKEGDRQMSGSTEDSRGQRSQYTSPDLGIESDPAHEFEAIVAARTNTDFLENEIAKENFDISNVPSFPCVDPFQKRKPSDTSLLLNKQQDHARQDLSNQWLDQMLYAVCQLQDYELLKKEIEESLILVKGIQARIKERILALSSKTSPIKSLEYSTLKELNHSCSNIELYLGKGCLLIGGFWTAPLSTRYMQSFIEEKDLIKENLLLSAELTAAREQLTLQTKELQEAREKIDVARNRKEKMERAISNQLVKTRQVLKEAKGNLTESRKHKHSNEIGIKTQQPTLKEACQVSK